MAPSNPENTIVTPMNARYPLQPPVTVSAPSVQDDDNEIDLIEYWDIILDNRWLVAAVMRSSHFPSTKPTS
jgi:hypothetical protein